MAVKTKTSVGKETASQTVARAKKLLGSSYDKNTKAPSSKRMDEIANQKFVSSSTRDAYNKSKTPVITPERVAPTEVADVPPVPVVQDVGNIFGAKNPEMSGLMAGMGYTQDANGLFVAPKEDAGTSSDLSGQANAFQNYIQQTLGNTPVNQEDIYNKSPELKEVTRAQKEVNQYSAQLNTITANSQAEQLKLEGQGRGQTSGFIGGEQARINREAAIAALPVQAQLAAAQGNLEFAQKQLDTLFTLRVADAQAKYNYNSNLISSVYNFASAIDQSRLNNLKAKEDRAFALQQQNIADAKQIAMQAIEYGQSSLAARVMGLDPKSATYEQDVRSAMAQLSKPVVATTLESDWELKEVNGVTSWVNKYTQEIKPADGGGAPADESFKSQVATQGRTAVNTMLGIAQKNPGIFGRTAALWLPDAVRSDAYRNYKAQLDALKGNIVPAALTAMREASKTGGALGNVSDKEGDRLAASLGALSMEQTPAQVMLQLKQIDASLARWQDAVDTYNASQTRGIITIGGDGLEYEIVEKPWQ